MNIFTNTKHFSLSKGFKIFMCMKNISTHNPLTATDENLVIRKQRVNNTQVLGKFRSKLGLNKILTLDFRLFENTEEPLHRENHTIIPPLLLGTPYRHSRITCFFLTTNSIRCSLVREDLL